MERIELPLAELADLGLTSTYYLAIGTAVGVLTDHLMPGLDTSKNKLMIALEVALHLSLIVAGFKVARDIVKRAPSPFASARGFDHAAMIDLAGAAVQGFATWSYAPKLVAKAGFLRESLSGMIAGFLGKELAQVRKSL